MRLKEEGYLFSYGFIFYFLWALLISYVITAAGVLGLAYLLLIFHIPIELTDGILYGIYWVSVLAGVFFLGTRKCDKIRFAGMFLGVFYCTLFFLLSSVINKEFQIWEKEHGFFLLSSILSGEAAELFLKIRAKAQKNKLFN